MSGHDVNLTATDTSTIHATIIGVAVAVGVGDTGGFGAAIGSSTARNSIGYAVDGTTFHGLRTFRARVTSCVDALLRRRVQHEIVTVEHAALVGAAVAALTN